MLEQIRALAEYTHYSLSDWQQCQLRTDWGRYVHPHYVRIETPFLVTLKVRLPGGFSTIEFVDKDGKRPLPPRLAPMNRRGDEVEFTYTITGAVT